MQPTTTYMLVPVSSYQPFLPQMPAPAVPQAPTNASLGGSESGIGGPNIGEPKSGLVYVGPLDQHGQKVQIIGWLPIYGPQAATGTGPNLGMEDGGSESPTTTGSGNTGGPKSGMSYRA